MLDVLPEDPEAGVVLKGHKAAVALRTDLVGGKQTVPIIVCLIIVQYYKYGKACLVHQLQKKYALQDVDFQINVE